MCSTLLGTRDLTNEYSCCSPSDKRYGSQLGLYFPGMTCLSPSAWTVSQTATALIGHVLALVILGLGKLATNFLSDKPLSLFGVPGAPISQVLVTAPLRLPALEYGGETLQSAVAQNAHVAEQHGRHARGEGAPRATHQDNMRRRGTDVSLAEELVSDEDVSIDPCSNRAPRKISGLVQQPRDIQGTPTVCRFNIGSDTGLIDPVLDSLVFLDSVVDPCHAAAEARHVCHWFAEAKVVVPGAVTTENEALLVSRLILLV